jgi:hypothetical protein
VRVARIERIADDRNHGFQTSQNFRIAKIEAIATECGIK